MRSAGAHRLELEADERVGHVHVDAELRLAHGGDRRRLGGHELEQVAQPRDRPR